MCWLAQKVLVLMLFGLQREYRIFKIESDSGEVKSWTLLSFYVKKLVLNACITHTAVVDQAHHKKGRRAKPRNWFYILICGGFESKLL